MAPKPPRHTSHVVDCPPSRHVGSRSGQATPASRDLKPACRRKLRIFLWVLLAAAAITGFVLMCVFLAREFPTGDPVFTVAVAGVASLDPVRDGNGGRTPAPLSPVFNLTFHIDNKRNSEYSACVPGLSSAAVSYGDALLGRGSVPPFCAKKKHESQPMAPATAWGDGVVLPRFLRDKLAGELAAGEQPSVDVKVTMPHYCSKLCFDAVLSCKAKIGGGPSPPCRLDSVLRTNDES